MGLSVLLLTVTSDLAADLLVIAARERRLALLRFNQDEFPDRNQIEWRGTGETRFRIDDSWFASCDISGAWFRRMPASLAGGDHAAAFQAREVEAFLRGVWESADWFWMNRPSSVSRAEYKLLQLHEARRLGFTIPPTVATNSPEVAKCMVGMNPTVAKTLAGGRIVVGDFEHAVFTTSVRMDDMADAEIRVCPLMLQRHVATSFDLRVTVVGDRTFAARIIVQDRTARDVDWRRADPSRVRYERHVLPDELAARCVKLVSRMQLSYGALDFIVTPDGDHVFLEINPSGQWGWIERALGFPIANAILDELQGSGQ